MSVRLSPELKARFYAASIKSANIQTKNQTLNAKYMH